MTSRSIASLRTLTAALDGIAARFAVAFAVHRAVQAVLALENQMNVSQQIPPSYLRAPLLACGSGKAESAQAGAGLRVTMRVVGALTLLLASRSVTAFRADLLAGDAHEPGRASTLPGDAIAGAAVLAFADLLAAKAAIN